MIIRLERSYNGIHSFLKFSLEENSCQTIGEDLELIKKIINLVDNYNSEQIEKA